MMKKTETWLFAAISLTVALGGCVVVSDDEGSSTVNTTDPMTTGENTSGEETGSTGGDSAATEEGSSDGAEGSSDGADSSTGSLTCDPECDPATEECVDGMCRPLPPTNSDYGPCDMCAPGEVPLGVMGQDFCVCSAPCDGIGSMCPTPNEGTAMAQCSIVTVMDEPPSQCALVCMEDADCPTGATCVTIPGGMICMHPIP